MGKLSNTLETSADINFDRNKHILGWVIDGEHEEIEDLRDLKKALKDAQPTNRVYKFGIFENSADLEE
jgi:hypothetical protein